MANAGYLPRHFAAQNISTTSHLYFEEWWLIILIAFCTNSDCFLSNDVQRMETAPKWILAINSAILQIVPATFIIAYLIGWQALMGEIFLWLLLPYYAEMSSVNAALRLRSAAESDMRISLTNQVVSGIRAIKAHAWEDEFREKIKHTRK